MNDSFKDCQCENCCQHAFQHVVKNHANGEESCLVATQGITVHDSHNDCVLRRNEMVQLSVRIEESYKSLSIR